MQNVAAINGGLNDADLCSIFHGFMVAEKMQSVSTDSLRHFMAMTPWEAEVFNKLIAFAESHDDLILVDQFVSIIDLLYAGHTLDDALEML